MEKITWPSTHKGNNFQRNSAMEEERFFMVHFIFLTEIPNSRPSDLTALYRNDQMLQ